LPCGVRTFLDLAVKQGRDHPESGGGTLGGEVPGEKRQVTKVPKADGVEELLAIRDCRWFVVTDYPLKIVVFRI